MRVRSPVRTTVRLDLPDGSALTLEHDDTPTVAWSRVGPDGRVVDRIEAEISAVGECTVTCRTDDRTAPAPCEPVASATGVNAFGVSLERAEYADGTEVEQCFDHDARLRDVTVRGWWGHQTLSLRPDGGRTLRWQNPLARGSRTWDSAGTDIGQTVAFSDGTTARWVHDDPPGPGPS